jgi:hypothetical protein
MLGYTVEEMIDSRSGSLALKEILFVRRFSQS